MEVKHPTAKAGGFYAVPPTEHTRRGLRGALPAPAFVAISVGGWWALPTSTIGTPNGLVR